MTVNFDLKLVKAAVASAGVPFAAAAAAAVEGAPGDIDHHGMVDADMDDLAELGDLGDLAEPGDLGEHGGSVEVPVVGGAAGAAAADAVELSSHERAEPEHLVEVNGGHMTLHGGHMMLHVCTQNMPCVVK